MFYVIFSNPGGELERREATDSRGAHIALRDMVHDLGPHLYDGDTFTIVEREDE